MKIWEKILLYPIGLYIWLTDRIKRLGKKWKPAMAMLMAVVMLCGLLPITATAASAAKIKVAGVELLDTGYYSMSTGSVGEKADGEPADKTGYVHWDKTGSTLTLYGVTIDGGSENSGIYANGDYSIILAENTANTVTSDFSNAITCDRGSITIKGSGTLQATGKTNGMKATYSVIIGGNVNVTVTGNNGCGIVNSPTTFSNNADPVRIEATAAASITGSTYGICVEGGYGASPVIDSPNVVIVGGTAAFSAFPHGAPKLGDTVGALAGDSESDLEAYNSDAYSTYKYVKTMVRPTCTVTFDKNGGTGTMEDAIGIFGEYTLPACGFTAPEGKQFKAWSVGGVEKAPGEKITVTVDTTVIAVWEDIATYTVSFDGNGASGYMKPVTVVSGEYILPENNWPINGFFAPHKKYFAGWRIDDTTVKAPGEKIIVTGDITLKAVWEVSHYDLTVGGVEVTYLNASGITGTNITGGTVTYDPATKTLTLDNATIYSAYMGGTMTAAVYTGLDFGHLTIKLVGSNTIYGDPFGGIAESSHRYAINCKDLTFTGDGSLVVTASDAEGGSFYYAIHSDNNIAVEGSCTITAVSKFGSALNFYNGALIANDSTVLASTSADGTPLAAYGEIGTYSSKYVKIQPAYTVKVSFDANGGTGSMAEENVVCASEYTLPANGFTAPDGKQFKAWSVNGAEKAVGDKVFFVTNTTVTAVWEDLPHSCSIQPVAKVWPTCEEAGKEAYYKCEDCGRFYEDADGTVEIPNIAAWGNLTKLGHTEGTAWEKDGTHHWHICTVADCGAVIDDSKAEHSSTGANAATCRKQAVCDICGASYGTVADHDPENTWSMDETGHWYACKTAGCTQKVRFAAHTPDHQGNATEEYAIKCSVCHYMIEQQLAHTHVFDQKVAEDQYLASGASCTDPAKYYFSCACGEKGTEIFESGCAAGHTAGTEWKSDKDNHWHECACGDQIGTAAHKDENKDGKCDACAYDVGLPTPPADPDHPKTGDNSNMALWFALMLLSACGLCVVLFPGVQKKGKYSR